MQDYKEIVKLREVKDDQKRGYLFEQLLREILPWERKPPLVAVTPTEQFDAVFVWRNLGYLIECKAKQGKITPGSHDWEDFELKVRKRNNNVVSIFCSLYEVSETIYEEANKLVTSGFTVIVLAGSFWDELDQLQFPLKDVFKRLFKIFGA